MTISFLQSATDTTDLTTYTFAGQNLGTAASDRYIIVAISTRKAGAGTTISSVTIGGVAALIASQVTSTATNTNVQGIAIANVPTGATGDIVITMGTAMLRMGIGIWRADNITGVTPYSTSTSIATNPTATMGVPYGFAIGSGCGATDVTWTGLTEDYDTSVETFLLFNGAHQEISNQQSLTMTMTHSGAEVEPTGVFASWRYLGRGSGSRTGGLRSAVASRTSAGSRSAVA